MSRITTKKTNQTKPVITKKTTITVPKKIVSAPKQEAAPKQKSLGTLVQHPKIQTAEGWVRSHADVKKRKKAE